MHIGGGGCVQVVVHKGRKGSFTTVSSAVFCCLAYRNFSSIFPCHVVIFSFLQAMSSVTYNCCLYIRVPMEEHGEHKEGVKLEGDSSKGTVVYKLKRLKEKQGAEGPVVPRGGCSSARQI